MINLLQKSMFHAPTELTTQHGNFESGDGFLKEKTPRNLIETIFWLI